MISELRKRHTGELYGSESLVSCLRPQKISLSKLVQLTPVLNNAMFLGFARHGKEVVAINDECVLLSPFLPFSIAVEHLPPCVKLMDEESSPLLDKRVLVLVHSESAVVATLLFCDSLDADRILQPDVRLKIYSGSDLICSRLLLARGDGHHIYENYGDLKNMSSVIVVSGCSQLYFYVVSRLASAARGGGSQATPQSSSSSAFDDMEVPDNKFVNEVFPCRSKWYWNCKGTCVCADCLAFKSSSPTASNSSDEAGGIQHVDENAPNEVIIVKPKPLELLQMEVEIDCDLLALVLLRKSFPAIAHISTVPSHLIYTETRLLCPDLPQVTQVSSSSERTHNIDSEVTAFHAVLGLCIPYNGKTLYIVWQLSIRPLVGQVCIRKVEDLVSFCKKVKIRGKPLIERSSFNSHADYLHCAVGHYAKYISRCVDEIAIGMQCNEMCEEFKSPALDGTTVSLLEIKHPVLPMAVYNDELFEDGE
jgi:hypothetical protein